MDRDASSSLADDFAAAREWWREAGVDLAFADEPTAWLGEAAPAPPEDAAPRPAEQPAQQPEPAPVAAIGGNPADWPGDPEAFAQWWLSEPSLDAGGANPRIAPRGKPEAKLMILVAHPEQEDRERLLSGPQGKLLSSFLSNAGVGEDEIYLASALPRHIPHADWQKLTRAGLAKVALHHIAIARPARLVLFGNDVLALLGNNPAQNPAFSLDLNHQGRSVPALSAMTLEHMLNVPSARSRFWRDWLDWTDH